MTGYIRKLKLDIYSDWEETVRESSWKMQEKIDELIDKVNELTEKVKKLEG